MIHRQFTIKFCSDEAETRDNDKANIDICENKVIEIDSEFSHVIVCGMYTIYDPRTEGILTLIGDSITKVHCMTDLSRVCLDNLPNLQYLMCRDITKENSKHIPKNIKYLDSRKQYDDFIPPASIEHMNCENTSMVLPPNLISLKYEKCNSTLFPESLKKIDCHEGDANGLPVFLETLVIYYDDPILENLCDICPSLINLFIEGDTYSTKKNMDSNSGVVGEYDAKISGLSIIWISDYILNRLPKSIKKLSMKNNIDVDTFDFSDFVNMEFLRCLYSDFENSCFGHACILRFFDVRRIDINIFG